MTKYCEVEAAELARFKAALKSKESELSALNERIRAIQSRQEAGVSAQERATALLEGRAVKGDLADLQGHAETLATTVAVLRQAVAEQQAHYRRALQQAAYKAYPANAKVREARQAFDQAMQLLEKGIALDAQAVRDLSAAGLPLVAPESTNQLFNERLFQLRNRWALGDLSPLPAVLR